MIGFKADEEGRVMFSSKDKTPEGGDRKQTNGAEHQTDEQIVAMLLYTNAHMRVRSEGIQSIRAQIDDTIVAMLLYTSEQKRS